MYHMCHNEASDLNVRACLQLMPIQISYESEVARTSAPFADGPHVILETLSLSFSLASAVSIAISPVGRSNHLCFHAFLICQIISKRKATHA